ncbi:hypothetical protein G6F62_014555 [Rhizopus arrhizus]|nr:hypothetical protein G6F62_014555 [Rhizopus arrhizus]
MWPTPPTPPSDPNAPILAERRPAIGDAVAHHDGRVARHVAVRLAGGVLARAGDHLRAVPVERAAHLRDAARFAKRRLAGRPVAIDLRGHHRTAGGDG